VREALKDCSEHYTHSTWRPSVTHTTSKQYSSSIHLSYSMSMISSVTMNPHENAKYSEWFTETKSETQVQRRFRTPYHKRPLSGLLVILDANSLRRLKVFRTRNMQSIHSYLIKMSIAQARFLSAVHVNRRKLHHELEVPHLTAYWIL
jgi:hypothetical protein